MTLIEELIDIGLSICKNSRITLSKSSSRSAVLYSFEKKIYTGCDVHLSNNENQGVSAERACILSAVADGASNFEVSY